MEQLECDYCEEEITVGSYKQVKFEDGATGMYHSVCRDLFTEGVDILGGRVEDL